MKTNSTTHNKYYYALKFGIAIKIVAYGIYH